MIRRERRTQIWVYLGALLLSHCGGGDRSSPTSPSGPAAGPTVTGVWDLTFAEVPPRGVLTLSENSGSVSGTLQIMGEAGSGTLNGTISSEGQMTLTGTEPGGAPADLQVTVDARRRELNGTLRIRFGDSAVSLTVRGSWRSLSPSPTPVPTSNNIDFLGSAPAPGSVIHTGLPDPASSPSGGVTTGLTMTFTVVSAVDRSARFQVFLEGQRNGVCLTNAAPSGVPAAPVVQLQAGIATTVTIKELLLTSTCRYPNAVEEATARLVPASAAEPDQTPFYEERFALQYSVAQ